MYQDKLRAAISLAIAAAAFSQAAVAQLGPTTSRISVSSTGAQGTGDSTYARVSGDGRTVAFSSEGNFGLGGGNRWHVFLRDLANDSLELISKSANGVVGDLDSFDPVPSADGRRIAFMSWARNLDPLDANNNADVFLHDRKTHKTYTISINLSGHTGTGLSADPDLTADGRYVTFKSGAADLVAGDVNTREDVFRRDTLLGVTELVSCNATGGQASSDSSFSSISDDGRFVAFQSAANDLVGTEIDYFDDIFVKDMLTGAVEQISIRPAGGMINAPCTYPTISADGTKVAYITDANTLIPGDTSGYRDVFVYDRTTASLVCASLTSTNVNANGPVISYKLSPDGLFVAFDNAANQIVPSDNNFIGDVFLCDLTLGTTSLVSVSTGLPSVPLGGEQPDVANGGIRTVFHSQAGQFVPNDTNGADDVFLRDLAPWTPYRYCKEKVNSLNCRPVIDFAGQSSASSVSGFTILGSLVRNNRAGILLYSIVGKNNAPFQGGTLCLATPIGRTPSVTSGGSPAPVQDCSGVLALDFNAFALGQLGGNPFFELQIPGTRVFAQWWSRDPGFPAPGASSLTDALSFTVLP